MSLPIRAASPHEQEVVQNIALQLMTLESIDVGVSILMDMIISASQQRGLSRELFLEVCALAWDGKVRQKLGELASPEVTS